jgi:hypothetical protein
MQRRQVQFEIGVKYVAPEKVEQIPTILRETVSAAAFQLRTGALSRLWQRRAQLQRSSIPSAADHMLTMNAFSGRSACGCSEWFSMMASVRNAAAAAACEQK